MTVTFTDFFSNLLSYWKSYCFGYPLLPLRDSNQNSNLQHRWAIRARKLNPGPTKWSWCTGRSSNPGPTKIDRVQGQGFKPWTDQKDRSYVRTIVHAIAKCNCSHNRKISRAYKIRADARTSSSLNVSAGRRMAARLSKKTDNGQTVFKMTDHPKRYVPCTTYLFEVPHHVPIHVHFYRLNQPATIRM